ncbi:MAG TPA: glycine cleavage system protein GcvH [Candidatus Obscuribacterales bacterium]
MSEYYYSKSHECFRLEGEIAVVSITEYAVAQLGEITYVQLPGVGKHYASGTPFGEIESVKTVSELYAPAAGEVIEANTALETQPELVNDDPLGQGWLLKLKLDKPGETGDLMDKQAYDAYLEGLS